ncbi:MAG: DUF1702 family protein [Phycisphaerae bacterium]|nr:DUF1702 family protein [Phycisphaerae bacterium]
MGHLAGWLRRYAFGISPEETSFVHRGFPGRDSPARERLEHVASMFVRGYHIALTNDKADALGQQLQSVELEVRGFAFEGAAMALALLDVLTPWRRNRVQAFLDGPGASHAYMVHVGVGWALARLRRRPDRWLDRFDPLLRWLVVDGYGFHECFFHRQRCIEQQAVPGHFRGYYRRAFDFGLGRCLWFVDGAEAERIAATIASFPPERRDDLWSGVGLACPYAGGADRGGVEALREAAGASLPCVAQGAAFAAKARQRAGNLAPHTEMACEVLCGMSAAQAAGITDAALESLPSDGAEPAFEVWRRRIKLSFAGGRVEPGIGPTNAGAVSGNPIANQGRRPRPHGLKPVARRGSESPHGLKPGARRDIERAERDGGRGP